MNTTYETEHLKNLNIKSSVFPPHRPDMESWFYQLEVSRNPVKKPISLDRHVFDTEVFTGTKKKTGTFQTILMNIKSVINHINL